MANLDEIKKLLGNPKICSTGDVIIPKHLLRAVLTEIERLERRNSFLESPAAANATTSV